MFKKFLNFMFKLTYNFLLTLRRTVACFRDIARGHIIITIVTTYHIVTRGIGQTDLTKSSTKAFLTEACDITRHSINASCIIQTDIVCAFIYHIACPAMKASFTCTRKTITTFIILTYPVMHAGFVRTMIHLHTLISSESGITRTLQSIFEYDRSPITTVVEGEALIDICCSACRGICS